MMVSTMGGCAASRSGRDLVCCVCFIPLQVVNQVTPDGAGIPWGAASRSGRDLPRPLALDPGGCGFSLVGFISLVVLSIVWVISRPLYRSGCFYSLAGD